MECLTARRHCANSTGRDNHLSAGKSLIFQAVFMDSSSGVPSSLSEPGLACAWVSEPSPAHLDGRAGIATAVAPRFSMNEEGLRAVFSMAQERWGRAVDIVAGCRQEHGGKIRRVEKSPNQNLAGNAPFVNPEICDGLWTSDAGVFLVVHTADCVPVALWDAVAAPRIALVHSGWRGTAANIVGAGVRALAKAGSRPQDLRIWIGPAISGGNFEIGEDVRTVFERQWPEWSDCWTQTTLDLTGIIKRQAMKEGVEACRIEECGLCTYAERETLPSHRREGKGRNRSLWTFAGLLDAGI